MIVAQDPKFSDAKWEKFNTKKTVTLTGGDGKNDLCEIQRFTGNETQTYSYLLKLILKHLRILN